MTTRHLCEAPRCAIRGQHLPACEDEQCRGCQPWVAADGYRLCDRCTERAGLDLAALPELHADLALVLATTGRPGERVSGGTSATLTLNDAATDMRTTIRATLVAWATIVATERGITRPARIIRYWAEQDRPHPDFIGPMPLEERTRTEEPPDRLLANFLRRHLDWIVAHKKAGEWVGHLGDLAATARRVAYPNGARTFTVGPCPREVDGQPCAGSLRAILRPADSLLPRELVCTEQADHRWDSTQWVRLGRELMGRAA